METDPTARIRELEELVIRLADRILAAHEVLANIAEKKVSNRHDDREQER